MPAPAPPTAMDVARANALAAQAQAELAEAQRYQSAEDIRAAHRTNTVLTESATHQRFLADLSRLEGEMAAQRSRAMAYDGAVRANPASPDRVRTAAPIQPLYRGF